MLYLDQRVLVLQGSFRADNHDNIKVDRSFYVIAMVIIIALLFFGFLLLNQVLRIPLGILFTVG